MEVTVVSKGAPLSTTFFVNPPSLSRRLPSMRWKTKTRDARRSRWMMCWSCKNLSARTVWRIIAAIARSLATNSGKLRISSASVPSASSRKMQIVFESLLQSWPKCSLLNQKIVSLDIFFFVKATEWASFQLTTNTCFATILQLEELPPAIRRDLRWSFDFVGSFSAQLWCRLRWLERYCAKIFIM